MAGGIQGGIKPLEIAAFKHRINTLDKLKCYKPRKKEDGTRELITMTVMGIYPYIIIMSYQGRNHKRQFTSMTWAEAVILNRMTQKELFEEVKLMQQEKGLSCYTIPVEEKKPRRAKIDRKKCAPLIVEYREIGMTFAQIASILGISASTAGDIFWHEGAK